LLYVTCGLEASVLSGFSGRVRLLVGGWFGERAQGRGKKRMLKPNEKE